MIESEFPDMGLLDSPPRLFVTLYTAEYIRRFMLIYTLKLNMKENCFFPRPLRSEIEIVRTTESIIFVFNLVFLLLLDV